MRIPAMAKIGDDGRIVRLLFAGLSGDSSAAVALTAAGRVEVKSRRSPDILTSLLTRLEQHQRLAIVADNGERAVSADLGVG